LDDKSRSEVYVSFDGKDNPCSSLSLQQQISGEHNNPDSIDDHYGPLERRGNHNRNDSTEKIMTRIEKIKKNQEIRVSIYNPYIPDEGGNQGTFNHR